MSNGLMVTALLPKPQFQVAAFQQRRQLAVAVTQVEDDGERVVLLQMGDQEVQQEALAAARGTEHEGVAHVLDVQVVEVGRLLTVSRTRPAPGGQGVG